MTTRNLLAKTFCLNRELVWAKQDGRAPCISSGTIEHLQAQLNERPIAELQQAAQDLGITLGTSYEC